MLPQTCEANFSSCCSCFSTGQVTHSHVEEGRVCSSMSTHMPVIDREGEYTPPTLLDFQTWMAVASTGFDLFCMGSFLSVWEFYFAKPPILNTEIRHGIVKMSWSITATKRLTLKVNISFRKSGVPIMSVFEKPLRKYND